MSFTYFYKFEPSVEGGIGGCKRPVVPIKIEGYEFTALVDSGSDVTIISREVATALKLKSIGSEKIRQMDGSFVECEIIEVKLEFGKGNTSHKFKIRALMGDAQRIVLGRKGFFDNFKITFFEQGESVTFKKTNLSKKSSYI